jgi:hypothetical protein
MRHSKGTLWQWFVAGAGAVALLLSAGAPVAAEEGKAERTGAEAGEKTDRAAAKTKKGVKKGAKATEETAADVGEKVGDKTETAGRRVKDAAKNRGNTDAK